MAALRAEIAELRTALDAFRSSSNNSNAIASLMEEVQQLKAQPPHEKEADTARPWSQVVRNGKGKGHGRKGRSMGIINNQKEACQGSARSNHNPNTASADCFIERTHVHRNCVPVKGARKVWGTLRSRTTHAVENTLRTLTNINAKGLVVKRKFKTARNDSGRVVKWWFVVRGEESVLEQLQKEWPTISIQTSWRLEPVLSYVDDLVAPTTEQLHIVEQLVQPPLASSQQAAVKQQQSSDEEASQSSQLNTRPATFLHP